MNEVTTIGIDLAKNVFELHGVNRCGKSVLRKTVSRSKLLSTLANLPPCVIGIEACGGAHYWAREIGKLGHEVRIMAPQFVVPYRRRGKNDANDAEAICEAVSRPNMHFVAIKTPGQQLGLMIHRVRESIKEARTAAINQIRGLLMEFGIVLPQEALSVFAEMRGHLLILEERLTEYDRKIAQLAREETARRLAEIPGVGPVTATALVATVSDARIFRNGREMAAWAGLVPRQNSSGGKSRLGKITKRGDSYIRSLCVQGALIVIRHLGEKNDPRSQWIRSLVARRGVHKAAVALAAKTLRVAWAIMARDERYRPALVQ